MSNKVENETEIYRYLIHSLRIMFPLTGKHEDVDPKMVQRLTIERDYETDFFPIMRIDISLDTTLYYKIIDNITTVKFQMRLQKYKADPDNVEKMGIKRDVFNDIFNVFIDDTTPFMDKASFDSAKELNPNDTNKTPENVGGSQLSLYLFKEADINSSKHITNTVLSSTSMTNAITYLLSNAGIKKVLMSPLQNAIGYNEVILPPLILLSALKYIDSQYGLHTAGTTIFFDIDCMYILNKSEQCTAFRKEEYKETIIYIPSSENVSRFTTGSFNDVKKKKFIIHVEPSSVQMRASSITNDQLEGNNRMIIDTKAGVTTKIEPTSTHRGKGTYKVMHNKYGNVFKHGSEKKRLETASRNKMIPLQDIDIDTITPNKQFMFTYEDKSINKEEGGIYRIAQNMIILQSSGEYYELKGSALFKK